MTFDEWLKKSYPGTYADRNFHGIREWVEFAELAWEAAKEDSKPIVKIVERTLYGGEKQYSIIGFDGFEVAIRSTLEKAREWAIDQGYKLK